MYKVKFQKKIVIDTQGEDYKLHFTTAKVYAMKKILCKCNILKKKLYFEQKSIEIKCTVYSTVLCKISIWNVTFVT